MLTELLRFRPFLRVAIRVCTISKVYNKGTDARTSESACVAELMKLYRKLTEQT